MKTLTKLTVFVYLLCAFNGAAFATGKNDEQIKRALDSMCEKLMKCAMETMQGEDLPKAMLDMFRQQTEMQCKQFITVDDTTLANQNLTEMGVKCLNDMASMSCGKLTMGEEPKSCQAFKQAGGG